MNRKFHVIRPARAGGVAISSQDEESVIAADSPPKIGGATVTEIDPETETFAWRPVFVPEPPQAAEGEAK